MQLLTLHSKERNNKRSYRTLKACTYYINEYINKLLFSIGFHASHMSVKANMGDIHENIKETRKEVEVHTKEAKSLRCDYGILEHQITTEFNTTLIDMMKEISKLDWSLKHVVNEDVFDTADLKDQIKVLIKEKILLQENVLNVTSRVASAEELIGYDKTKMMKPQFDDLELPEQQQEIMPEGEEYDENIE